MLTSFLSALTAWLYIFGEHIFHYFNNNIIRSLVPKGPGRSTLQLVQGGTNCVLLNVDLNLATFVPSRMSVHG